MHAGFCSTTAGSRRRSGRCSLERGVDPRVPKLGATRTVSSWADDDEASGVINAG